MRAAAASKPAKASRPGLAAALGREVRDRLHARGERRLDERRPGSPDTVRFTWRTPRGEGEKAVAFIRPKSADLTHPDHPGPSSVDQTETQSARRDRQDTTAPTVPNTPATAGDPTTATRKVAERSTRIMPTSRYTISLEPPTTDGEFLEQSAGVAQALTGLAEQIEAWTDGLAALNLPAPILESFQSIPEGLVTAASQATAGAQQFETHFEETRAVAQRGMRFTGNDGA